jgi:outer membrane autotransporter protein
MPIKVENIRMSQSVEQQSTNFKIKKLVLCLSLIGAFSGAVCAQTVTVVGNVTPQKNDGNASPWSPVGDIELGAGGFIVVDGGVVNGSGNKVTLEDDTFIRLMNKGVVNSIGDISMGGDSRLEILDGGQFTGVKSLSLRGSLTSNNMVRMSGAGSLLKVGAVSVGLASNSLAGIYQYGGTIFANSLMMGGGANGRTELIIDGAETLFDVSESVSLVSDSGAVWVLNGGRFNVGKSFSIGSALFPDAEDSLFVYGNGSSVIVGDTIYIGSGNKLSSVTVTVGGLVRANKIMMAQQSGGLHTLSLLSDNGSRGVLETGQISSNSTTDARLNFDGGILRATANAADFIVGFAPVPLGSQGLYMDTNGFNVGISAIFTDNTTSSPAAFINKLGAGTLTLSGNNTYSGGTFVSQGLLVAGNNSALGSGAVNIGGTGQAAQLRVDSGIALANVINIRNQGVLYGVGQVGNTTVAQGGVISPGIDDGEIATLTVNGNVDFRGGGTYRAVFATDDSYNSDLLKVTGTAFLTGGTLYHTASTPDYEIGKLYEVLEASTVDGAFSKLDSDSDLLNLEAYYDVPGVVNVGLIRNDVSIESLGLTPNQKATGAALDKIDQKDRLDEYVLTLPKGTVPIGLDFLSGEVHATVRSSVLSWSNMAAQQSVDQFRNNLSYAQNACNAPMQSAVMNCSDKQRVPAWVQIIGNWREISTDDNAAKSKQDTVGFVLGADYEIADSGWRVGGSFAYGKTNLHVDARNSTADIDNYSLAAYVGKRFPMGDANINVIGGVSYTNHAIKTDRSIPRINQNLTSNYHGNTVQLFGEVGYAMAPVGSVVFEPFVGLNVAQQKLGSFSEVGSYAGVNAGSGTDTYTTSTLGLRAQSNFEVSGKPAQVQGMLGWKQVIGSNDVTRTMAFNVGSPDYTIAAVPLARSTAVLSLQGAMNLSPTATLEASVGGEFGHKVSDQFVQARLRWAF